MTYGAGVAIEFSDRLPIHIQKAENDKKKLLGIDYKLYGWFVKGHKKNGLKKCQYNWCYDDEEIKDAVHAYKYIQRIAVSVINTHLVSTIP